MDDNTSGAICDYFCQRFGIDGNTHESRGAEAVVRRALMALPQPDVWFCDPHGGLGEDVEPTALLLAGDRLIQVRAGRDGDEASDVSLRSKSWPLVDSGAVIELMWGDREATQESVHIHTTWAFNFQDGESVVVRGRVQTMPEDGLDPAEQFARAVAAELGEHLGN